MVKGKHMDLEYYMKLQNAYGAKNKREKDLAKTNHEMSLHFRDTYDTETVLRNGNPMELMIIKDTDGNVFKKKIKSCHNDKFNLGDYIIWNNQYWLITLLDPDEKTWNRGYMFLCTVMLRWQDSDGNIIEKPVYSEDFTKYSSGVTGNNIITIGDNQYGLTAPIDKDTKKLKRDMRFAIDLDDAEQPDIYRLTNKKVNLNNNIYFGRGGTMVLTMSYDSFNNDKDKIINFNDKNVWICDYSYSPSPQPPPPNETSVLNASINGKDELKIGIPRTYTVKFTNQNGAEITDVDFTWNVVSDFYIKQEVYKNKIELYVDDEDMISSSFLLQILNAKNNSVLSEINISIIEI